MRKARGERAARPLDETALRELAMAYVARFATTAAKLRSYLGRKLRERGWDGAEEPDLDRLTARMVELGLVDDRAFAEARSRSLLARGYGERRVSQVLAAAGVADEDRTDARTLAQDQAFEAALRFARKRRLGPFAAQPQHDPKLRDKALAAMMRAGHSFAVAKAVLELSNSGNEPRLLP
ncbi:hypothetical protein HMF7854_05115 [Sphingomonas ginkgonis]|uniref:Regulatory protein RecX n=1 Tax=Sphingomonas ginkgonis TaxID=2315330 RepID=A0A3R9Y4Z4_9SPHN|nr:regulatory protein RecX [Sphingomonas ginkgonis]RST30271.1 hypothetical protein HMF7854_05115 [Sphingomonas ginkgonis]